MSNKRLLVAYASEFGTTAEIARVIAETLRDAATTVDVSLVVDVDDLSPYHAAVVGSPIYNGAWLPEAVYFLQSWKADLSRMPVAYFAISMTMRKDTAANRRTVLSYLEPLQTAAPQVRPVDIGLFAGSMRYRNLGLFERIYFAITARLPSGDYRDWAAIRSWTAKIRPELLGEQRGVACD